MGKTSRDGPSPSMKPARVKSAVAAVAVAVAAIVVVVAAVVEAEAIEDAASQRPLFILQSYPSSFNEVGWLLLPFTLRPAHLGLRRQLRSLGTSGARRDIGRLCK